MTMNESRSFYYHYSKNESVKQRQPTMRIVVDGEEYYVTAIVCNVPCRSSTFYACASIVMEGECQSFKVESGIAYLS